MIQIRNLSNRQEHLSLHLRIEFSTQILQKRLRFSMIR